MNRLAGYWLVLRDRPFFMLGLLAGVAAVLFIFLNTITINNRVTKVESHSPCTNLTAHDCALKLFSYLTPDEQQGIRERVRQLRLQQQALLRQRTSLNNQINRQRRVAGESPPRSNGQGPNAHTNPPPSTGNPQPNPGGGGNGGGGQPPTTTQPVVRTPPITTPPVTTPVLTVPTVTVPSLTVPCIEINGIIHCQ